MAKECAVARGHGIPVICAPHDTSCVACTQACRCPDTPASIGRCLRAPYSRSAPSSRVTRATARDPVALAITSVLARALYGREFHASVPARRGSNEDGAAAAARKPAISVHLHRRYLLSSWATRRGRQAPIADTHTHLTSVVAAPSSQLIRERDNNARTRAIGAQHTRARTPAVSSGGVTNELRRIGPPTAATAAAAAGNQLQTVRHASGRRRCQSARPTPRRPGRARETARLIYISRALERDASTDGRTERTAPAPSTVDNTNPPGWTRPTEPISSWLIGRRPRLALLRQLGRDEMTWSRSFHNSDSDSGVAHHCLPACVSCARRSRGLATNPSVCFQDWRMTEEDG